MLDGPSFTGLAGTRSHADSGSGVRVGDSGVRGARRGEKETPPAAGASSQPKGKSSSARCSSAPWSVTQCASSPGAIVSVDAPAGASGRSKSKSPSARRSGARCSSDTWSVAQCASQPGATGTRARTQIVVTFARDAQLAFARDAQLAFAREAQLAFARTGIFTGSRIPGSIASSTHRTTDAAAPALGSCPRRGAAKIADAQTAQCIASCPCG